ncbi:TPA: hypothetical protein QDB21_005627 [Burkholderia vietnamiensis]|nr:hypothetical protein [Burkholderia vietnamiensis]
MEYKAAIGFGSSVERTIMGPPTEKQARGVVASIDEAVRAWGGSATFDRVDGFDVFYTLRMPAAVERFDMPAVAVEALRLS